MIRKADWPTPKPWRVLESQAHGGHVTIAQVPTWHEAMEVVDVESDLEDWDERVTGIAAMVERAKERVAAREITVLVENDQAPA